MKTFLFRVIALTLLSGVVFAIGEKTFDWTPPDQYVDGTPLAQADIASYDIECDGTHLVNVPNVPLNTDTYQTPANTFATGTHSCVAFTVTTEGVRSEASAPVNFTVAPGQPAPPTNFAVQ